MFSTKSSIVLVVAYLLFQTVGVTFAKRWGIGGRLLDALIVSFMYAAANVVWLMLMRRVNALMQMTVMFSLMMGVVVVIVAVPLYGETLTLKQWCGVALAVVSGLLLS